ncbi:sulfotransferase domain-containing protein [Pontimonas salivibrio]|nr:sulfotransferase domain-containing protein [Pontimonas salivibrio]
MGVGVQKAGTSSVAAFLRESGAHMPLFAQSRSKELHWFKPRRRTSPIRQMAYRLNFSRHRVSGEYTPNYIEHPLSLGQLAEAAPRAKILVFLRNPFQRTISALNHARGLGVINPDTPGDVLIEQAWRADGNSWLARSIRRSTYVSDLEVLFKLFPRDRVFIGFFEHWVSPEHGMTVATELTQFLVLPSPDETGASIRKANEAEWHLRKNGAKRLEISEATEHRLRDYFSQFVPQLEAEVGPIPW